MMEMYSYSYVAGTYVTLTLLLPYICIQLCSMYNYTHIHKGDGYNYNNLKLPIHVIYPGPHYEIYECI